MQLNKDHFFFKFLLNRLHDIQMIYITYGYPIRALLKNLFPMESSYNNNNLHNGI